MSSHSVGIGGRTMASIRPFAMKTRSRVSPAGFISAGFLILLGTVVQLGVLGYGPASSHNFWLLSLIAGSVWQMLAAHPIAPALNAQLQFWPMLLVAIGLAILFDARRGHRIRAGDRFGSRMGGNHVQ
jgi:hypothetical protein